MIVKPEEKTAIIKEAVFKLCIFGDGGVGKTTLVKRYMTDLFSDGTTMTIGVDFHIKKLYVEDIKVTLQIWDFAGEDRFRFLLPTYLRGASGAIFMYDITRYSSLKNLESWLEVYNEGRKYESVDIPLILVGGKLDLEEKRSIERGTAIQTAGNHNFSGFVECSAKTGQNVQETFTALTRLMLLQSKAF